MPIRRYAAFHFSLEVDGVERAGFAEVSGLSASTSPIDYRDGTGTANTVRKISGSSKSDSITLKRGVIDAPWFEEWLRGAADGTPRRHAVSITLRDPTGKPAARWRLTRAWISKYEGPSMNAQGNDVAIESLELAHDGLTLDG